jgi:ABC-type branched-subunit amino acid transport system substrate-binding protein
MTDRYVRAALTSLIIAALLSAIHHVLEIGELGALIAVAVTLAGYGLMLWFKRKQSRVSLLLYALLSVWLITTFGFLHGFLEHAVPLVRELAQDGIASHSTTLPRDLSGIAMTAVSPWLAWTAYRFLAAAGDRRAEVAAQMNRWPMIAPVASVILLTAITAAAAYDRATSIRVAVIAPMSGPAAVLAQSFVRAVEMARDDLGPAGKRFRLVTVDTTGSTERARRVIEQTFGVGRIDAVLGAVSASGQFTASQATAKRVPHICICSVQTIGDAQYNFTNIPLPEDEATRWVEEALRRGTKSVAIVAEEEPSIRNHADAMKREAAQRGIQILSDRRFPSGTTDFALLSAEARSVDADVIFAEAFPPVLDRLVQELRRQGATNIGSIVTPSASRHSAVFEGVWYTDTNLADPAFQSRFEARFPNVLFAAHMTPYAYDSFNILAKALTYGGDPAAHVRGVTRYDGIAGTVTREIGSGNFRSRPAVWIIEAGRPRQLLP